jgi:hypothetical protein
MVLLEPPGIDARLPAGSGFPENLGEEFDAPFARLDWISRNRFDIQWHRHTGEWFCLHCGLTLAEAIDTLKSDGLLHPL